MTGMWDDRGWRPFLDRWSADWLAARALEGGTERDADAAHAEGLGFAPASEERIAALEARLGVRMPPSYRSFLSVSDGWRHASGSVYLLGRTDGVHWHGDPVGMREIYELGFDADPDPDPRAVSLAGLWERGLQLALDSDATDVLLDPADVDATGEWAVYVYEGWSGEFPTRHASFTEFMRDAFRGFHARHGGCPAFATPTTRAWDEVVERARLESLGGAVSGPRATLAEAARYGRVRAQGLSAQLEAMLGGAPRFTGERRLDDPLFADEWLPLLATEHARHHHDDERFLQPYEGADRARAAAVLAETAGRTFRYEPPGVFGRAVATAREQARWGGAEEAWRTIATAVGDWRPYHEGHLAPVGLLADPLLGPLITPERGRQLLATPRAGRRGPEPGPAVAPAVPRPDGLAWLAEPGESRYGYRCVLARGIAPAVLARRIGAGPLLGPHNRDEVWIRQGQSGGGLTGTREYARVGACGGGWSFGFDGDPPSFNLHWLSDLCEPASVDGGAALAVWCERQDRTPGVPPTAFHFAYAEDGRQRYGFTVRGDSVQRSGPLPATLDPGALFARPDAPPVGGPAADMPAAPSAAGQSTAESAPTGERRALVAIADAFGVSLPRFAIRHGRLHVVPSKSWTRAPRAGEGYSDVVRMDFGTPPLTPRAHPAAPRPKPRGGGVVRRLGQSS